MTEEKVNPHLILPAGTQVVTLVDVRQRESQEMRKSGAVGKIIKSPTDNNHTYLVQFPDGTEATVYRQEMAIRKHLQNLKLDRPTHGLFERDLNDFVIYRCTVGSRAYGLDVDNSDTDKRGIYLPPAELHWSLYGVPEQIDDAENQECYWELQKFITLALKANPNILECLYTPLVETVDPIAQELLDGRTHFLSKLIYQTYNGYVLSQFRKSEQDLRTRGQPKSKHIMHLVRLLISGIVALRDGHVPVRVEEHRDVLMAIRTGHMGWEEVNEWRMDLHKQFDEAHETTSLPERPNYEWANDFLVRARAQRARSASEIS